MGRVAAITLLSLVSTALAAAPFLGKIEFSRHVQPILSANCFFNSRLDAKLTGVEGGDVIKEILL